MDAGHLGEVHQPRDGNAHRARAVGQTRADRSLHRFERGVRHRAGDDEVDRLADSRHVDDCEVSDQAAGTDIVEARRDDRRRGRLRGDRKRENEEKRKTSCHEVHGPLEVEALGAEARA